MKTLFRLVILFSSLAFQSHIRAQETHPSLSKTESKMKQIVIDKLSVPLPAEEEFLKRMNINRAILKQIPGFIKDEVFVRADENGNVVYVTVAQWKDADVLQKAKAQVEAEYKKTGFNVQEFCQKLNIKMERAIYQSKDN